jgi:hypothetical protein
VLIALLGCASRRVDLTLPPPTPEASYSAVLSGSLTWHGKGIPITGGCAVDPLQGIRLELRDTLGMTRLLLLVNAKECRLVDPAAGLVSTWSSPGRDIPWASEDLIFLFLGHRPPGLTRLTVRTGRPMLEASWKNGLGKVTAELEPLEGGACPFRQAVVMGPGAARLKLNWTSVLAASFPDDAFDPPSMALKPVGADRLLSEIQP